MSLAVIHLLWAYTGMALRFAASFWIMFRGGRNEKIAMILVLYTEVFCDIAQGDVYTAFLPATRWVDAIAAVLLLWLSLKIRTLWSLCLTACQLITVAVPAIGHTLSALNQVAVITAYGLFGGYLETFCLIAAMVARELRLRKAAGSKASGQKALPA